jgi:hypothetical protein
MGSKYVLVAEYDAEGGPDSPGAGSDGLPAGPTPKGNFVIAKCAPHHDSSLYPTWSTLAWGTPLREYNGDVEYQSKGAWLSLTALWNLKHASSVTLIPDNTVLAVKERYDRLYGEHKVPNTWVFNDFGHIACYVFKDVNHNGVFDAKVEKLRTEYIHTTPSNEAAFARSPKATITLDRSHGCVHVKPNDITEMISKGYLKKGNQFIVHSYAAMAPIQTTVSGGPPYEVHFFPGSGLIQIRGHHHATPKHHR